MLDKFINRNNSSGKYADPDREKHGAQGGVASVIDLVPVQRLFGNMTVLRDGSFRMVLKSGAVNFDLKSPREQNLILNTFGELLNSLSIDFPIQILLHAAHLDTQRYINRYERRFDEPDLSPEMAAVIDDHLSFFEHQARANYLLDRSFYIVIPFYGQGRAAALGDGGIGADMPGGGFVKSFLDNPDKEKGKEPTRREMELARVQLLNRSALIIAQLSRLGINAELLDELQLVGLLRELYNPGISERQKIRSVDEIGSLISVTARSSGDRQRGRS